MGKPYPKEVFRRGAHNNANGEFGCKQRKNYGGEFLVFDGDESDINMDGAHIRDPETSITIRFRDCAKGIEVFLPLGDVRVRERHYRTVPQKVTGKNGVRPLLSILEPH